MKKKEKISNPTPVEVGVIKPITEGFSRVMTSDTSALTGTIQMAPGGSLTTQGLTISSAPITFKETIPVKKLSTSAILPTKGRETDAGFDLYTLNREKLASTTRKAIPTGIALNIPKGYYGQICERSGFSLLNTLKIKAGIVDAGYTGEIKVVMQNCGDYPVELEEHTKFAQIIILPLPDVTLNEVSEFEDTDRGDKGFGSSDK